ncbi:J domain-containing protein [Roseateles cellulosilyticus]|uniref:J domain-containing protein n=1 Tax=Pelomonas cellulosilytica TaxID=2906762 RepID=A0ABS8XR93_9BURK|nr:J domain-containing protein [Pelomonas sp. P8]MCE4553273.1 J domain-containing protein [Pelomonas sp. P8]
MAGTAITRHELTRRREQLQDLRGYLAVLEADHDGLRAKLLGFRQRYLEALGPLMRELDDLEAQLHQATALLFDALKRQGVDAPMPNRPPPKPWPDVPALPEAVPLPLEPTGPTADLPPPTLKTLYRRAAMRFHPDLAPSGPEREVCEQRMMAVNEAYGLGDRAKLETLLLAAGELPERVLGGPADAVRAWLGLCEHMVQSRIRIVQAQTALLQSLQMHELRVAIERAEAGGMKPLEIMANRLRAQIAERRQELYIGERVGGDARLAADFLRKRYQRLTGLGLG